MWGMYTPYPGATVYYSPSKKIYYIKTVDVNTAKTPLTLWSRFIWSTGNCAVAIALSSGGCDIGQNGDPTGLQAEARHYWTLR